MNRSAAIRMRLIIDMIFDIFHSDTSNKQGTDFIILVMTESTSNIISTQINRSVTARFKINLFGIVCRISRLQTTMTVITFPKPITTPNAAQTDKYKMFCQVNAYMTSWRVTVACTDAVSTVDIPIVFS